MNYIKTCALKLLTELNGEIRYSDLKLFIESKGFIFIEFNTDNGDNAAKMLDIYDNCINCDGKTIIKNGIKIVAIDGSLCVDDKIRVTLHEIGHILLHIPHVSSLADTTVIGRDNEAEAFVHDVFRLSKYGILFKRSYRLTAIAILCLALCTFAAVMSVQSIAAVKVQPQEVIPEATPITTPASFPTTAPIVEPTAPQGDNLVYITPTGRKYHRPDCSSVNLSKARATTAEEAERQGLQPCKKCNP